MNVNNVFRAFEDSANLAWATILALLTEFFGAARLVLPFFLVLNVVDCYYGRKKGKETATLSSKIGAAGIAKKVSYWVMIGLSLGIELGFLMLIGWFTLAVYVLNELTSIVENMLVLGYDVPPILVKGLAAARSAVDEAGNKIVPGQGKEDENHDNGL